MSLPPCHMVYFFWQAELPSPQRSGDLLLGVPFNWTGGATLLLMIAQQTGLTPGEFFGLEATYIFISTTSSRPRTPRQWPKMRLLRKPDSIDDYRIEDFEVDGYDPHHAIKADVAV